MHVCNASGCAFINCGFQLISLKNPQSELKETLKSSTENFSYLSLPEK